MTHNTNLLAGCGLLCLALCSCGGGGGGGVASIPPPPTQPGDPPPPPVTGASVSIFPNPTVGEFASVGVATSATGTGGSSKTFGALSSADADQVHVRYTSTGSYEIEMPGKDWERLVIAKNVTPQDPSTFNYFQPQSAPINGAYLITSVAKLEGYKYSEMASWWDGATKFGELAFGAATAAGQAPVTGSATYQGLVSGTSDVIGFDSFDGNYNVPIKGSVDLSFDFANGTLAGSMSVALVDTTKTDLGSFAFTDTVFSAGSTTYSGKFDTPDAGQNFFLGRFTGPNAEETIGAWALPFHLTGDAQAHQAFGAWIAKH